MVGGLNEMFGSLGMDPTRPKDENALGSMPAVDRGRLGEVLLQQLATGGRKFAQHLGSIPVTS